MTTSTPAQLSSAFIASVKAASPHARTLREEESHVTRGSHVHHLDEDYAVHEAMLDEYTTITTVFGEDWEELVSAQFDIYENRALALEALAFAATVAPLPHTVSGRTDELLRWLVGHYTSFWSAAARPEGTAQTSDDVRLAAGLLRWRLMGRSAESFFMPPEPRRKTPAPQSPAARLGGNRALVEEFVENALAGR